MVAATLSGPRRLAATQRRRSAWHGNGHGLIPCAGNIDDSELVRDSPIKCRDDFHSFSHCFDRESARARGVDAQQTASVQQPKEFDDEAEGNESGCRAHREIDGGIGAHAHARDAM
ncbi:hypothetical protein C5O80_15940 [Burkholderia sp. SRS-46]|nr:hypothetical protein C5O80_15940 [Burkholderia sp. SRS-46]